MYIFGVFYYEKCNSFIRSHFVWTPSKTVMVNILNRHGALSFDEQSEFISTFSDQSMTVRQMSNILDLVLYTKEKKDLVIQKMLQSR